MNGTGSKDQATCNEQPARPANSTILLRRLSHHELATLLLLHAPIDAQAKPELFALKEAGLVEQVPGNAAAGAAQIRLTPEGKAVLQGLGVAR